MPAPTYHITGNTNDSLNLSRAKSGALILYGRGSDLGDFAIFAKSLQKELSSTYSKNILSKKIERKGEFLTFLSTTKFEFQVRELHVFSHAFGTGLALGYGDPTISQERQNFINNNLDSYYRANKLDQLHDEIIKLEKGILFIDDLLDAPLEK